MGRRRGGLKKELSLCHKLWFSKTYIFATQWRRSKIFQTMNSIRLNNLSLQYHFVAKICFIRTFELVEKTDFHCSDSWMVGFVPVDILQKKSRTRHRAIFCIKICILSTFDHCCLNKATLDFVSSHRTISNNTGSFSLTNLVELNRWCLGAE